ncbi:MAG TPA: FumA C-terminus/TtdB family hydratase beta subunit [bacterium]|nr:FumA C-terminus/TtdB family hydratase beta subunit [bacterium]HOL67767.1 FumA C-terminus/TtdB family hydratase beta subunit [bacterium]HPP12607.1 FumA C-terminus/TtdB family hydratase beta subunit [bacterium]
MGRIFNRSYPLRFPVEETSLLSLKIGDPVAISGEIYVARDAAHQRMLAALQENRALPFPLENGLIYYMGPTPAPPGFVIGSCGPTTSSRMDKFTIPLLARGLRATMGKGRRSPAIASACRKYRAVYLATYGGCGAYLNRFVRECVLLAYPELGPEAIYRLKVREFPAIVVIDVTGRDFYAEREKRYNDSQRP